MLIKFNKHEYNRIECKSLHIYIIKEYLPLRIYVIKTLMAKLKVHMNKYTTFLALCY